MWGPLSSCSMPHSVFVVRHNSAGSSFRCREDKEISPYLLLILVPLLSCLLSLLLEEKYLGGVYTATERPCGNVSPPE